MKVHFFLMSLIFLFSCKNDRFTVSRIVNGNTLELSNGVIVHLEGIEDSRDNVKILERYASGSISLYDNENELITKLKGTNISAFVYNSDGDCINDLLKRATQITEDKNPVFEKHIESTNKTSVSMQSKDGVYTIPVQVDGELLYFIFDTGASMITISEYEASNLYNLGKITEDDFVGKGQFTDANGDISEGTIINLKMVKIGDRILHDVLATVIEGQNAPLLFGQSALQKFGKVSIDYNKNEITFE